MKYITLVLFLSLFLWIPEVTQGQEEIDLTESSSPELQAYDNGSTKATAKELGLGVGSVFASILYSPLKVTYAGLGLITGGVSYVVSGGRSDVAKSIIQPAVRGNYVITPHHLLGKERVIFVGPPVLQEDMPPPTVATADPAMPG